MIRRLLTFGLVALLAPAPAWAWGFEGHQVIALIARGYLTPDVGAKVDALLASDTDVLTGHDMAAEATWADAFRSAGHRETAQWHFVDIELDHPDLQQACFGFPPPSSANASAGPANDCVVDKVEAFAAELRDPATSPAERLLALKYLLHFVGDVHQPLHASDNHDRGGNCVLLSLGGPRTTNLHSYWDTGVLEALGSSAPAIAERLRSSITPALRAQWAQGGVRDWALESYGVAKASVYVIGSRPGCDRDAAPMALPSGYAAQAQVVAAVQLKKAGVRLAAVLNGALR